MIIHYNLLLNYKISKGRPINSIIWNFVYWNVYCGVSVAR